MLINEGADCSIANLAGIEIFALQFTEGVYRGPIQGVNMLHDLQNRVMFVRSPFTSGDGGGVLGFLQIMEQA